MKKVAIIDCGISNLTSVYNALEFLNIDVQIVRSDKELERFSHLVLPGVGSFKQGMLNLRKNYLDEAILKNVKKGKPLLGICLGMQLLATRGEEFEINDGLELIPGDIKKIRLNSSDLRIPHVGWNNVSYPKPSRLWDGIKENSSFYFAHSYAYVNISDECVIGICEYGTRIIAAVECKQVFGVQFHPEKSQENGINLMRNFVNIC